MGQFTVTRTRDFIGGAAAINAYLRVKLSGGQLALAGASDVEVGVTDTYAQTQGLPYSVVLRSAQGTLKMTASGAISQFADAYADANGLITATPGAVYIGKVLQAATANGDIIEVLRLASPVGDVVGGVTPGMRVAVGKTVLSGSSPLAIVTGLNTITGAAASLMIVGGAAPGLDPVQLAVDFGGTVTAGTLDVYPYKATSVSNPTLVASTNSTDTVSWIAFGT